MTVDELVPATAALHRAMPFTRLVDYGMNPADAGALLAATAEGSAGAEVAGELAEALSEPAIERVELPHRDRRLVGCLCLPRAGTAAATVVVWGGLSGWGAAYLGVADALTARGLACLLAEGPGQGEPRPDGEHTLYNHAAERDAATADWFGDHLDVG